MAYKEKDTVVYSRDPKTVAEEFNHFFSTVGKNAAMAASQLMQDNIIHSDTSSVTALDRHPLCESDMYKFNPVSCIDVKNIITSMPTNKAPSKDKISMRIIKDCLTVILGTITDIINTSLMSSTFPKIWKEAEVIPLIKEGDHELPSNNRVLSPFLLLRRRSARKSP